MANTDLSHYASDVLVQRNGYSGPEWWKAGDSLMKPGYVCMEDDADEVKICSTSGIPYGVVGFKTGHEIDTVYTANERIPVFPIGCGAVVWVKHDGTNQTVAKGTAVVRSNGTAGAVENRSYETKSTSYTYGDFTDDESFQYAVGRPDRRKATGGVAVFVRVRI